MNHGIRFTETMTGFVTLGANDFDDGYERGQRAGMECTFHVTVRIPDVERHLNDDESWAVVDGQLYCPALGGEIRISDGRFKLFDCGGGNPMPRMRYRLPFVAADGTQYELVGSKHIGHGRNPWKDTTRLKVEIRHGRDTGLLEAGGSLPLAAGQVRITARAFARQLTTVRTGVAAGRQFAAAFARTIVDVYRPAWPSPANAMAAIAIARAA